MANTKRTFRLPRLFRKDAEAVTVDGRHELEVAFQVHELLAPLPATSQARVLNHVNDIFEDNAARLAQFDAAIANDFTQPVRKKA